MFNNQLTNVRSEDIHADLYMCTKHSDLSSEVKLKTDVTLYHNTGQLQSKISDPSTASFLLLRESNTVSLALYVSL